LGSLQCSPDLLAGFILRGGERVQEGRERHRAKEGEGREEREGNWGVRKERKRKEGGRGEGKGRDNPPTYLAMLAALCIVVLTTERMKNINNFTEG